MNHYETFAKAIETAQEAQRAIIDIEATQSNRTTLDAAYRGLALAIENLWRLIDPEDSDADGCPRENREKSIPFA